MVSVFYRFTIYSTMIIISTIIFIFWWINECIWQRQKLLATNKFDLKDKTNITIAGENKQVKWKKKWFSSCVSCIFQNGLRKIWTIGLRSWLDIRVAHKSTYPIMNLHIIFFIKIQHFLKIFSIYNFDLQCKPSSHKPLKKKKRLKNDFVHLMNKNSIASKKISNFKEIKIISENVKLNFVYKMQKNIIIICRWFVVEFFVKFFFNFHYFVK